MVTQVHHDPKNNGGEASESLKKNCRVVGILGGNGGSSWDDGVSDGIREITLVYDTCVRSICVLYDKNGEPVQGERHGGVGGPGHTKQVVKLDYPKEYLVSISGSYGTANKVRLPVLRSLTFKTNKRTHGPFGVEEGTPLTFPVYKGKIVGFRGRGNWYIDAVGYYLYQPQSTNLCEKICRMFGCLS